MSELRERITEALVWMGVDKHQAVGDVMAVLEAIEGDETT
jgi:hypothetical protein